MKQKSHVKHKRTRTQTHFNVFSHAALSTTRASDTHDPPQKVACFNVQPKNHNSHNVKMIIHVYTHVMQDSCGGCVSTHACCELHLRTAFQLYLVSLMTIKIRTRLTSATYQAQAGLQVDSWHAPVNQLTCKCIFRKQTRQLRIEHHRLQRFLVHPLQERSPAVLHVHPRQGLRLTEAAANMAQNLIFPRFKHRLQW